MADDAVRQSEPEPHVSDKEGEYASNLEGQTKNTHANNRFHKNDPFGDEAEGEVGTVKYVTMSWW